MVPDYSIAGEESFCDGPVVILPGVAEGTYAHSGILKSENRWKTPVAIRTEVEDGLASGWRVHADNEPIRKLVQASS
jgi:hypothetical protein